MAWRSQESKAPCCEAVANLDSQSEGIFLSAAKSAPSCVSEVAWARAPVQVAAASNAEQIDEAVSQGVLSQLTSTVMGLGWV